MLSIIQLKMYLFTVLYKTREMIHRYIINKIRSYTLL
jgi:hypothetical protein